MRSFHPKIRFTLTVVEATRKNIGVTPLELKNKIVLKHTNLKDITGNSLYVTEIKESVKNLDII